MAKTVFAGQQVKEFSSVLAGAMLTSLREPFSGLSKHLFVRDRPADACHGNGKDKQPE